MRKLLPRVAFLALLCFAGMPTLMAQLSGSYTINPSAAASATNYRNFISAANDLAGANRTDGGPNQGPGVNGAVTITVAAGTYTERVQLGNVTGVSATNTVTFDGVDPATRIVTSAGTSNQDYTFRINGADYITIKNLTIQNTGTTRGYGLQIYNNANNLTIEDNIFRCDSNATGTYVIPLICGTTYTASGYNTTNTTIQRNEFIGGRFNLVMNGQSGVYATGNKVLHNTFRQSYFSAFYIQYQSGLELKYNDISMRPTYAFGYGGQLRYNSLFDVQFNNFRNTGRYGLYLYYINTNIFSGRATFANNMIGGDFSSTSTAYGLYVFNSRYIDFLHNSVYLNHPGTFGYGMYMLGSCTGNKVMNNVFAVAPTGGTSGYATYMSNTSYVDSVDYNLYYTNGATLCYFQGVANSIGALQTLQSGYNQNSREGWPNFLARNDLHTFGTPLNNWAKNYGSMTQDIDGDTRPLAPDTVKDVGADEIVLADYDLDLLQVVSPTVLGLGNNTVCVEVMNGGNNSLNGRPATMQYSTNGGTSWVSQVYTPTTLGSSGDRDTFCFSVPWNITTAGTYNFCVRANPSVAGDPDSTDQICSSACTGMSGAYTVNSGSATGGTNYNSFTDLATALNACGINGPVYVTVAAGTYNDNFELDNVLGTSAFNTITIDGQSVAACTLSYNTSTINEAVIRLKGTDYVTIKHMTITAPGTYGYGVHFQDQADYNTVDSCNIVLPAQSTSAYHIPIVMSGQYYYTSGNNANYTTISNCRLTGGYYGVRCNGPGIGSYTYGNKWINNEISNFYYTGIYAIYQHAPQYEDNVITGRTSATSSGYGIYSYYSDSSFSIQRNIIHSVGSRGIYLGYGNASNTGTGKVINNMIGAGWTSTFTCYGLQLYNTKNTQFYHNSVSLGNRTGYALYVSGTSTGMSDLDFRNNIFAADGNGFGSGYAAYVSLPAGISNWDYNLLYSTSTTNFVRWGGNNFSNLATWKLSFPLINQNSLEDRPGFISERNLHIVCSEVDNGGLNLGINEDIDGDSRSVTTPDIGADEFTAITVSVSLGNDTSNCGQYIMVADTNKWSLFDWNPGGGRYFQQIDTSGTYELVVTDSNNCRARDTIAVTILDLPSKPYKLDTFTQCNYTMLDAGNPGSAYLWSTGDTSQTLLPPSPGTYGVSITSTDGCVQTDSVTVGFYPQPVVSLGANRSFCLGTSAILDAGTQSTGSIYTWNTGASTQVVLATAPGRYIVTVTSPDGCIAIDSVSLNSQLPPVVNLGTNRTECDNNFTLDAGNPGSTYTWSNGSTSQTIAPGVSGTYSVTVTNAVGCTGTSTVQITVGQRPTPSLGPDVIVCNGQNVTLDAGIAGMNYRWSNGATTQTISVSAAGTYIVDVIDPITGCVGTDDIKVNKSFLSVNLGPNGPLCDGSTVTLDAGAGATSYSWSNGANTQTISVTQGGSYTVTVTDALGCSATDNIVLTSVQGIQAQYTSATQVPLFQSLTFTDQSFRGTAVSWFWDFGDGTSSTAQNPTHQWLAKGVFNVCLTVNDGTCSSTFCTDITVIDPISIEDPILAAGISVFPNPSNGVFRIGFDLNEYTDFNLTILDVTGRTVYSRFLNNVQKQNVPVDIATQPAGIYMVRLNTTDGREVVKRIILR